MDNLTLEEKRQQFQELFSVKHTINVNIVPLSPEQKVPDVENLTEYMPYAFRIASDIATIEAKALRPLRSISDHASELAEFLNHQSHKIDLIMSYVLRQEDHSDHQFQSIAFGGSGVTIISDKPMEMESIHELKLFLDVEASAVFCYGEVIECNLIPQKEDDSACTDEPQQYNVSLVFTRIREQDQELLVRASLHVQTQQLRKTRNPNSNS